VREIRAHYEKTEEEAVVSLIRKYAGKKNRKLDTDEAEQIFDL
jgi:hypothetical protein